MTKLLLCLLLLQSLTTTQTEGWIRLEPEGAGFSVMMPAKPVEHVSRKKKLTLHAFIAQVGNEMYVANYSDYLQPRTATLDEGLQAERDNFNAGIKATLVNSRSITQAGLQGLDFTSETTGGIVHGKVFLKGQRVFMIVALVPKDVDQTKTIQTFIDSLTFTEQ